MLERGESRKERQNMTLYVYMVIREYMDGSQGKRARQLCHFEPDLQVGHLYVHLGTGYPGLQRVLSMTTEEFPD